MKTTKRIKDTIKKYGIEMCLEARRQNLEDGNGAMTIGYNLVGTGYDGKDQVIGDRLCDAGVYIQEILDQIKLSALIDAGYYRIGVGSYETGEIAVFNGCMDFVPLSNYKKSKRLAKLKRKTKYALNSDETFTYSHVVPNVVVEMVLILRGVL